jgi:tetratricopeptide (TPR) repeat protein
MRSLFQVGLLLAWMGGSVLAPGALAAAPKGDAELAAAMSNGLVALYEQGKPEQAVTLFRQVLSQLPSHYGANYQLAVALGRTGRAEEARAQWQKMQEMAESIGDRATAEAARTEAQAVVLAARMGQGMDLLYEKGEPEQAAAAFRQVLADLPTHYGASFQLGRALARSGKAAEATTLFERVAGMAKGYGDRPTEELCRQEIDSMRMADGMAQGVKALYERKEPSAAVVLFRGVLQVLPSHYGGNYQLAVALDAAGRSREASAQWRKVLELAQDAKDPVVVAQARARIAEKR